MPSYKKENLENLVTALIAKYGILLRKIELAEVLKISPESLHNTLRSGRLPHLDYLWQNRCRVGRRVYFAAQTVAEALMLDDETLLLRLNAG